MPRSGGSVDRRATKVVRGSPLPTKLGVRGNARIAIVHCAAASERRVARHASVTLMTMTMKRWHPHRCRHWFRRHRRTRTLLPRRCRSPDSAVHKGITASVLIRGDSSGLQGGGRSRDSPVHRHRQQALRRAVSVHSTRHSGAAPEGPPNVKATCRRQACQCTRAARARMPRRSCAPP